MAKYLVKCWSNWHKGYTGLVIDADSKEEAKAFVRDTEFDCGGRSGKNSETLRFTPVGAKEIVIDEHGNKIAVKVTGRTHREEVEEQKKPQTKNFVVTFKSYKDGATKTTVVKALNVRDAKSKVSSFGKALKAELAKGQNKKPKAKHRVEPNEDYSLYRGIRIYFVSREEQERRAKATAGWPSYYVVRAGSLKSGMTK